jgi:hypothetical protein
MKKLLITATFLMSVHAFAQSVQRDQIKLTLKDVGVSDSIMQMQFVIKNKSAVAYRPAFIEYVVQDKKRLKRTAQQETALTPLQTETIDVLKGNTQQSFTVCFSPFMLPSGQVLSVRAAEANGARALALKIKSKRLLKAKKLKHGNDAADTGAQRANAKL